jgi:hypothetical protein
MPQLFLYTDEAMIDPATAVVMQEAGVIPVKVASLDAVRLVSCVPLPMESNRLLLEAVATIGKHSCNEPTRAFVKAFENELRRSMEGAP